MATLTELVENSTLLPLRVALDPPDRERREIYATQRAHNWIVNILPTVTACDQTDATPKEQMYIILKAFTSGEALEEGDEFRLMRPIDDDVYELKSPDLRLFGWFYDKGKFIITAIDTMERVHTYNLSDGYQNEVIRVRQSIDLDPPKYQVGAPVSYVFSV